MSAVPAKTADPSMEEILASIRRIIADDDDKAPPPEPKSAETEKKPEENEAEPVVATTQVAAATPAPETDDDPEEILDLASIEDQIKPDTSLEIDLPDLSFQAAPAPRPAEPLSPVTPVPERQEPAPAPSAPPPTVMPVQAAPAPRTPQPEPLRETPAAGEPAPRILPPDAILSQETTASVGQAFNLLSHTIMSQNAHTLEDVVREMLKPMLKTWLDDNLPPLVERLVTAEIQRVARGQR